MKSKITAVLAVLLLHVTAFSFGRHVKPVAVNISREVALAGKFQHISVGNNVQLVLVPGDQQAAVTIEGAENLVDLVNVTFSKNEMRISSKKNLKQGRIVVYVPAKDITNIRLNEGSSVSAQGFLKTGDLTVVLHAGSRVNLAAFGNITLKGADGCDVEYEKFEKMKVMIIEK